MAKIHHPGMNMSLLKDEIIFTISSGSISYKSIEFVHLAPRNFLKSSAGGAAMSYLLSFSLLATSVK